MTSPPRHPRFERAAAALRENLKRRKAQSRARVIEGDRLAASDEIVASGHARGSDGPAKA